jgi:hypothetical protein
MKNEIKLLASEVTLDTTPSDFSENTRIRITNANSVASGTINVVTQKRLQDTSKPFDAGTNPYNVTVGTISILPTQTVTIGKLSTDTLEATGTSCKAVAIFDVDGV